MKNKIHSLNTNGKSIGKYNEFIIKNIVKKVEIGTGKTLKELKKIHKEEQRYRIGLNEISTTDKAICTALKIPVEAGTRYKRRLEEQSQLVSSVNELFCPFTKHKAHVLTTNPNEFENLRKTNQLKLF